MKAIHPTLRCTAALAAAAWLAAAVGCRNQSSSALPNPFLAPDRVPPPATRAIMPGQAQPYYPGDPLPVMQSSVMPPGSPPATNIQNATTPIASDGALTWGSPSGAETASPNANPNQPLAIAVANEPSVAIPSDSDSLRYPLPTPEPPAISPIAAATPQQPVQLAAMQTGPAAPASAMPISTGPSAQTVVPASYLAPDSNSPTPTGVVQPSGAATPDTNPWRSPQTASATAATSFGIPQIMPGNSTVLQQPNNLDVRLRAVPSPPPEPIQPTTPRIRLPGSDAPPSTTGVSITGQPAPVYAAAVPPGPLVQTVQIGPLPPSSVTVAETLTAADSTTVAGVDGFRPRTSMR